MSNEQTALAVVQTDEQMLASANVTHESIKPFFYKTPQGVDMSADGIGVVARRLCISMESCDIVSENEHVIRVKASAVDAQGNRWFGFSEQPKTFKGKPDEHYYAKACTKAQRNARKGLMPMEWLKDAGRKAFNQQVTFTGELADVSDTDALQDRIDKSIEEYRKLKAENDELKTKLAIQKDPSIQAEGESREAYLKRVERGLTSDGPQVGGEIDMAPSELDEPEAEEDIL